MSHEKSHQTHCPDCALGTFTRNHYFTGKLLVERDFTDEQRFHIDKLRHHHQRLHGWGVVCGLKVKQHPNPSAQADCLLIEPGTAIDCCGHEILVREEVPFHFSGASVLKALQALQPPDTAYHTLQICIKYKECGTEQIPVLFDECGCDETRCAANRILESYELDVMPASPPDEVPQKDNCAEVLWKGLDGCDTCETANCVVLATIKDYHVGDKLADPPADSVNDPGAHIVRIDNRTGRRLLPSTQVLTEVVQCVLDHPGGGQGQKGDKGDKGDKGEKGEKGDPGTGLNFELPHIVAINWPHNGAVVAGKLGRGLIIAFDQEMLPETIHDPGKNDQNGTCVFEVRTRAKGQDGPVQCFCSLTGEVLPVRVLTDGENAEIPKCDQAITGFKLLSPGEPATGALFGANFIPGDYRVTVRGDFILGKKTVTVNGVKRNPALDANHLGPGLLGPDLPGRCPTGDGIEGGTFESWFTVTAQ